MEQPQLLPIVHHPAYDAAELSDKHRFPMRKFRALAENLLSDGLVTAKGVGSFHVPVPAPQSWLALAHSRVYVDQVLNGTLPTVIAKDIGFPLDNAAAGRAVAFRGRCATAGTVLTAMLALEHGIACNTAGGSHHARYEQGAGFCVFNDVAVAIRVLLADHRIRSALILDLDVHQGDGTALMFADDAHITTISMHAEHNYPHPKAQSDIDIALPDAMEDAAYLARVKFMLDGLPSSVRPDIVFYNAGVDPHAEDRLGRLNLTDDGLRQRDRLVLSHCRIRGWPVACVIGGGYSRDIVALGRRHAIVHHVASDFVSNAL